MGVNPASSEAKALMMEPIVKEMKGAASAFTGVLVNDSGLSIDANGDPVC